MWWHLVHPAILNQFRVDVVTGNRAEAYLHMMQQDGISSSISSRMTYVFISMDNSVCIVYVIRATQCVLGTKRQQQVHFTTALIKVQNSMRRAVACKQLVHSNSAAMST